MKIALVTGMLVSCLLLEAAQGMRALSTNTILPRLAASSKCEQHNRELSKFLSEIRQEEVLPKSTEYEDFVKEMKASLDAHMLPDRAIHHLFSDQAAFQPWCDGDWLEFGVAYAATINLAAKWRSEHCGECPFVHGFDTFEVECSLPSQDLVLRGLPEKWNRDDTTQYEAGAFDLEGQFPAVEPNVNLVKGLFNASLPAFLKRQAAYGAADSPLSFLHIDCDLYRGASDAFQLLAHKIVPGTVIVFDDIVNYQHYREGEMLAWWEYLQASGAKFVTIGMLGPLPGRDYAMELSMPNGAEEWHSQSAAFVIVSVPGKQNPFERERRADIKQRSLNDGKLGHMGEATRKRREPEVMSTLDGGESLLHG